MARALTLKTSNSIQPYVDQASPFMHVTNRMLISLLMLLLLTDTVWAWSERTHLAVAKAAGYEKWYNAAAADILKVKVGKGEQYNHYFNTEATQITPTMVLDQAKAYDSPSDDEGHLYGAIIASLRLYVRGAPGKESHLAIASHYIGDLSNPLHNITYDDFNKSRHSGSDNRVDKDLADEQEVARTDEIKAKTYEIKISPDHWEADMAREIARIAILSRQLGIRMRDENRNMTKEEAYTQLGHSASLLKAVISASRAIQ